VVGWTYDPNTHEAMEGNFAVRYDAASQAYVITLPSLGSVTGNFISTSEDDSFWDGYIGLNTSLSIFKPLATNPKIQLTYTSFLDASVTIPHDDTELNYNVDSLFAFGIPTPGSGVPLTGTASYDAYAIGGSPAGPIGGDATLQFDFGAGTLAGHFDPNLVSFDLDTNSPIYTSLGRYDFIDTVFGVGSATFSGGLSHSGTSTVGSFNGLFTGPAAQELMARWIAPYRDPSSQQWSTMSGIWVGKKCC
jgi:hypothetical protein